MISDMTSRRSSCLLSFAIPVARVAHTVIITLVPCFDLPLGFHRSNPTNRTSSVNINVRLTEQQPDGVSVHTSAHSPSKLRGIPYMALTRCNSVPIKGPLAKCHHLDDNICIWMCAQGRVSSLDISYSTCYERIQGNLQ